MEQLPLTRRCHPGFHGLKMRPNKKSTFGPTKRLKKPQQFNDVFTTRTSVADSHLIIYARPNQLSFCRIGLGVGKKLGNAVYRNRYKRKLREAFRLSQHELPLSCDLVLIPRPTPTPSTQQYSQSLQSLCQRLQRRLGKKKNHVD